MQTLQQVQAAASAGDPEAQELLAQVHEESGRPQEAFAWLSRAASMRHSANARLGLWMLVGYGAPPNPRLGVERIMAAASAGDPLGLTLAGVVDAGGVGTPRNILRALQWLVAAADSGDPHAACQLGLLIGVGGPNDDLARCALSQAAAEGFEPAIAALGDAMRFETAMDWSLALPAIDISAFAAPITRTLERESPRIEILSDLLPGWACDYVMALAGPTLTRGKVLDESGTERVRSERSNSVMNFGLMDSDVILELINARLAQAAGFPAENAEGLGVLHYAPGERYAPHVDFIPETPQNAAHLAARGQRVRTMVLYLNDDFEGGATEFPHLEASFKPGRGSAVLFDSVKPDGQVDPMSLHTGAPTSRGEKWAISKWFRTRALRPGPLTGAL